MAIAHSPSLLKVFACGSTCLKVLTKSEKKLEKLQKETAKIAKNPEKFQKEPAKIRDI